MSNQVKEMTRRDALRVGLAGAAMLLVAGCASLRRGSDLDRAYGDLRRILDELADGDEEQARLASIANRIEEQCRAVLREHDDFRETFDERSRQRDTSSDELQELVDGFTARRARLRDDILRAQDELRSELTEEEWDHAARELTATKQAAARPAVVEEG